MCVASALKVLHVHRLDAGCAWRIKSSGFVAVRQGCCATLSRSLPALEASSTSARWYWPVTWRPQCDLDFFRFSAAPEVEVHRKEANALRDFCVFLESSDHASRRHERSRAIDAPCGLGQASAGNTRANFNTSESTNRITVSKKRPINHDDGSSLCPRL